MNKVTIEQLLLAGAHFGHLTRRWNPKMKPYIFMAKNGIHIIDLNKTVQKIDQICPLLSQIAAKGEQILFVGTKKQAKELIKSEAERINMPYVSERWLGGMLTNFTTIRRSIRRLEDLEKKEKDGTYQKIAKKEILYIEREKEKKLEILGGIRKMNRTPGAIFIVDTNKEHIAVAEARKLNIPVFAIIDTNCDPKSADYFIPANDDAFKSIGMITRVIANAIEEGANLHQERQSQIGGGERAKDGEKSNKPTGRPVIRRKTTGDNKDRGEQRPRDRRNFKSQPKED